MKYNACLENDSINTLIALALKQLAKAGVEQGDRLRFSLSMEEILLSCPP